MKIVVDMNLGNDWVASRTLPSHSGDLVIEASRHSSIDIEAGALVTFHASGFRTRPLPI